MSRDTLVTGAAGFVGANLVRELLREGHSVRVLDNLSVGRIEYLEGLEFEFVEGDILDRSTVRRAVAGVRNVVHLAAQTGVPGSLEDPFRDCQVNVVGTLNMLEASRLEGVRRFVLSSSNAPLGRQKSPASEDKAPLPISPYGASKLACEGYCLAYHGSWGLGTLALRFANAYGPYSAHKSSVVAAFCRQGLGDGRITIHGDGNQTRDFVYVADLCRAVVRGIHSEVAGEVFQIATGVETSIGGLARELEDLTGRRLHRTHSVERQGDIRRNYSAIDKAWRLLKWKPSVGIRQGLAETFQWFAQREAGGDLPVSQGDPRP